MNHLFRSCHVLGLAALLSIAACGSDSAPAGPIVPDDEEEEPEDPGLVFAEGGVGIAYPEMVATLGGLRDVLDEIYLDWDGDITLDGAAERDAFLSAQDQRIAAAARLLPHVALAEAVEGDHTVTVVLDNGLHVVIINNRPVGMVPADPALASQPARLPGLAASTAAATSDRGLPGETRAFVAEPFGGGFAAVAGAMAGAHGYQVNHAAGTVEDFAAMQGYGLVYVDTHGGVFRTVSPHQGGFNWRDVWMYVLATSTEFPPSQEAIAPYLHGLGTLELAVTVSPPADPEAEGAESTIAFGITANFIRNRWELDDAVVLLHVCRAGGGHADGITATDLRDAIFMAGGAAVMAPTGDTDTRFARASMEYFLDRLLGHNQTQAQDPPQRPFGVEAVWNDMGDRGLHTFMVGGLVPGEAGFITQVPYWVTWAFEAQGDYGALRPSIERMEVDDDPVQADYGLLTLHGIFGPREGTVQVGTDELVVDSWEAGEIVARLPVSGPASSGRVEVHHESTKSNPANLTEWQGPISATYHVGVGDLTVEIDADVAFRADVRPFRERIGEEPEARPAEILSHLGSSALAQAHGSYTHATEVGTVSIRYSGGSEPEIPPRPVIDGFMNFSGQAATAADPGAGQASAAGSGMYFVVGEIDPEAGQAQLCIHVQGVFTQTTVYPPFPGSPGTVVDDGSWQLPAHESLFDQIRGLVGCLNVSVGDDFVIPRVDRTLPLGDGEVVFRAGPFTPTHVPHSEHAR